MSDPWDRPSSDDRDVWPGEDIGPSSARRTDAPRQHAEASYRDPATEGAPGWDDWPPPPPPADYLIDEPLPPTSDPWAESWMVEDADAMLGASASSAHAYEPAARPVEPEYRPPEPEYRPLEPEDPPFEPAYRSPEPVDRAPEPEAITEVVPEPMPQAPPADDLPSPFAADRSDAPVFGADAPVSDPWSERPAVEPWSPDPDPWQFDSAAPAASSPAAEPAVPEPATEPWSTTAPPPAGPASEPESTAAEPEPVPPWRPDDQPAVTGWEAATVPEREAEADVAGVEPSVGESPSEPPTSAPVVRWPRPPEAMPDWLEPEPAPETSPSRAAEQELDAAFAALAERARRAQAEAEPAGDAAEPWAEAEPGPAKPASVPFWKSILPWRSREEPAVETEVAAEEAVEEATPAVGDAVEAEASASAPAADAEPRWPASVPEPMEAASETHARPAGPVVEPTLPQAWPDHDLPVEPAQPEPPQAAPEPEPPQAAPEPEPAQAAPEPEAASAQAGVVPIIGGLRFDAHPRGDAADAVAPSPEDAAAAEAGATDADSWAGWFTPAAEPAAAQAAGAGPVVQPDLPDIGPPIVAPEPEPEPLRREPEPASEPEPQGSGAEPSAAAVEAAPWAGAWSDGGESTRVLPTDWSPTPSERPLPRPVLGEELQAGPIRTRLAEPDADLDEETEPEATIAEQAVPWLIGVILLLAGMVIVLLALIFAGDASLGGGGGASPTATPQPTFAAGIGMSPEPSSTADASPASPDATPSPRPTPTPTPGAQYGPLEMVYQGRAAALAPIYLLHVDFTVEEQVREPEVLAQDAGIDVRRFAWAHDGTVGAGLLADVLVSIEPGEAKRRLGDGLTTVTFGDDASTVYAVRITEEGTEDVATVVEIDFETGDASDLASVTYERPQSGSETPLAAAQFADDGGPVRLFWMADDKLRLWVFDAGAWNIDPETGDVSELDGAPLPILWAPNGKHRIEVTEEDGTSTLSMRNTNGRAEAQTEVEGMVSHVRWSPRSDRVVFTVGRSTPNGGVLQDLFLWDLADGQEPIQLTNTGAAFGAEWRGAKLMWRAE